MRGNKTYPSVNIEFGSFVHHLCAPYIPISRSGGNQRSEILLTFGIDDDVPRFQIGLQSVIKSKSWTPATPSTAFGNKHQNLR